MGGLGFTVCAPGFPCQLEVFEAIQHLWLTCGVGVSRKSEDLGRYLTGRIFLSALGGLRDDAAKKKDQLKVQKDVGKATL